MRHRSAIPLLRAILRDNAYSNVQVTACFALATLLKDQAEATGDSGDGDEAEKLFDRIVSEFGRTTNSRGQNLAERAESNVFELRHLGIGKTAPDIEGEDLDGREMKLSDFRDKVVVVNFWATWCGPCMEMIPDERRLVERMSGRPFALIGVNADHDESKLRSALKQERITWPSFRDGNAGLIAKAWNVRSWPTIYVLHAEGVIRYRDVRGQALFDAVETLMDEIADNSTSSDG